MKKKSPLKGLHLNILSQVSLHLKSTVPANSGSATEFETKPSFLGCIRRFRRRLRSVVLPPPLRAINGILHGNFGLGALPSARHPLALGRARNPGGILNGMNVRQCFNIIKQLDFYNPCFLKVHRFSYYHETLHIQGKKTLKGQS